MPITSEMESLVTYYMKKLEAKKDSDFKIEETSVKFNDTEQQTDVMGYDFDSLNDLHEKIGK